MVITIISNLGSLIIANLTLSLNYPFLVHNCTPKWCGRLKSRPTRLLIDAVEFIRQTDIYDQDNTSQTKWKGGRCHEQYMHVSALYENGFFLTYYVYMCFPVTFSSTCNFKVHIRFVRLRRKLVRRKFNTLILKHNHPKEV